jgi:hypothetical protein
MTSHSLTPDYSLVAIKASATTTTESMLLSKGVHWSRTHHRALPAIIRLPATEASRVMQRVFCGSPVTDTQIFISRYLGTSISSPTPFQKRSPVPTTPPPRTPSQPPSIATLPPCGRPTWADHLDAFMAEVEGPGRLAGPHGGLQEAQREAHVRAIRLSHDVRAVSRQMTRCGIQIATPA